MFKNTLFPLLLALAVLPVFGQRQAPQNAAPVKRPIAAFDARDLAAANDSVAVQTNARALVERRRAGLEALDRKSVV
jgi:hypothetical protein